MTWEGRYNRGPQLDVLCAQRRGSKEGDTIETRPASGHPDGVETQLLCLLNECEYLRGLIPTDSDAKQSVWHTLSSYIFCVFAALGDGVACAGSNLATPLPKPACGASATGSRRCCKAAGRVAPHMVVKRTI